MFRPYTWAELISLSDEQIIAAYDESVNATAVGTEYYLEEIRHRRQARVDMPTASAPLAWKILRIVFSG